MSEARESRDIDVRAIAWAIVALFAVIAAAGAVLYWLYPTNVAAFEPPSTAWTQEVRDEPPLQISPTRDLAKLRREQYSRLHSYGWADRRGGIARIPIEQAMDLLPQLRPELVIEPEAAASTGQDSL